MRVVSCYQLWQLFQVVVAVGGSRWCSGDTCALLCPHKYEQWTSKSSTLWNNYINLSNFQEDIEEK